LVYFLLLNISDTLSVLSERMEILFLICWEIY